MVYCLQVKQTELKIYMELKLHKINFQIQNFNYLKKLHEN